MWAFLSAFLFSIAVPLALKLLVGLGIGITVYSGLDLIVDTGRDYVMQQYDGLPSDLLSILTILGLQTGINMVFAAFAARMAIMTTAGALSKLQFTKPTL